MMTTDETPAIDSRTFRNVLGQFCTGLTIITTHISDSQGTSIVPIGFACQSFAALSLDPPMVLFCPAKGTRSWSAIEQTGYFCVNILTQEQQQLCARFGSRNPDKFAGTPWYLSELNLPVLDDTLATIQCVVESVADGGDHYVVVGRVLALSETAATDDAPLLFYRGQYSAIQPVKTTPDAWRSDLEDFLTTTTFDSWL